MEPVQFLDAVTGYARNGQTSSADKPIKLAVVDDAYDPFSGTYPEAIPAARVTFEGESTLSGKAYPVAPGYIPTSGARVWMVPIGRTYLIAGGAAQHSSQGFFASPDGFEIGVDFGEGNYWDSFSGLNLDTDADIGGELTIGPRAVRVPEFRFGSATINGPGAGTSMNAVVNFVPAFPVGTTVFCLAEIKGQPGGTSSAYTRSTCTNSAITLLIVKSDAARANFAAGENFTVHWLAWAVPSN